jgi:hypothetical protein
LVARVPIRSDPQIGPSATEDQAVPHPRAKIPEGKVEIGFVSPGSP